MSSPDNLHIGISLCAGLSRMQSGEYAFPAIDYFRWQPTKSSLVVQSSKNETIDEIVNKIVDKNIKTMLILHGISGTISCLSCSRNEDNVNHIILLATQEPENSPRLYLPRSGKIVYIFDGGKWITLPENAPKYGSFVQFKKETLDTGERHMSLYYYDAQANWQFSLDNEFWPERFEQP